MLKKAVIVLLIAVILLIAAFFCIGILFPSVEYSTKVEINAPRNVTWQVMRDRKDWIYGFNSYEQLSGTPNEPGSKARVSVIRDGRETTFETELIAIKPPEYVLSRLTNDMLIHDATVRLNESGDKTIVVSDEKLEGKSAFWRSIFAIFRSRIIETSRKNFDGLKQAVETSQ